MTPPRPPGRRPPGPGRSPRAPRPIERSPGLEEDQEHLLRQAARPPASSLKRLEEEEKELARRTTSVHAGLRLSFMGVVILGLFSAVIFRLWSLQVLNSSQALKSVTSITTRPVTVTPPRGLIEARGGQVVVSDKVEPVVTLNRQVAANDPAVISRLSVALNIPVAQIKADLANQQNSIYQPVPVEVGVPASSVVYLAEHRSLFPGVSVSDVAERQYPYKSLAAQSLGYVGDINSAQLQALQKQGYTAGDVIGQSGIEAEYEKFLRGQPGVRNILVDAAGVPVGTKSVTPAKPGDEVVLNMDLALEKTAQSYLAQELSTLQATGYPGATSGSVVVLDPQNGAVLAMVSLPSYNPQWWVGGISEQHYRYLTSLSASDPLLNRAIQGEYTPGSTFKIATATAALRTGLITPYTYINDPGSFTIPNCTGNCTFIDAESGGCYCNVTKAIAISDDVFFYTMGFDFFVNQRRYGPDPIQKAAAQYGFGRQPGIDLPPGSANTGQVDSPQLRQYLHRLAPKAYPYTYYGPGDALETAFGQGETLVSPIQLAEAYSTFANGGTRYAPRLAAEIISPSGKVVKRIKPKVLGHVPLSPADHAAMLQGFEDEVLTPGGTAYQDFVSLHYPYAQMPIAGKTGTSNVSATNPNLTDSLYVAFGPVSHPTYCIAAVIPRAGYGAGAAAPVVFHIFEWLIHHPLPKLRPSAPQGAG